MQFSLRTILVLVLVSLSLVLAQDETADEGVEEILADDSASEDGVKEEEEAKGEVGERKEEEEEPHEAPSGVRDPKPCEVCKYLAVELQGRLEETGRRKQYIETGHGIMPGDRKKKDYKKSELRLIEAVHDPHVCDKILQYDVHAEHRKSLRYAKGPSETRRTLHALVNKGVKVELGIPYEMWERDSPPNEITHLQRLCIEMVERHEEDIEDWYWGHQEVSLLHYLCRDRALKTDDAGCLTEKLAAEGEKKEETKEHKESEKEADTPKEASQKGDPGTPSRNMPPVSPSPTPSLRQDTPKDIRADSDSIKNTPPPGDKAMPRTVPPPTKTKIPAPSSQSPGKDEL
ncbi:protein canopy 4-like [Littorina saxatilis]|uniref:protein canopy 4-like n=1 Tax=Littorina saxatilis TaxID=31220 RepID=UPI0038B6461F